MWWFDFVFNRLGAVRPLTRHLVRVLDSRCFVKDAYDFVSDQHDRTLQQSFKCALGLLPKVDSILLDGHASLDPSFLIGPSAIHDDVSIPPTYPLLLSIAGCPYHLPGTFFNAPSLQHLVYLDISSVPGSLTSLIQPALLPDLRILKIRGRELDNATLMALAGLFRLRLWSLDVSDNRVSDAALDALRDKCFPTTQLRSKAHFRVEGRLVAEDKGTPEYGPFCSIEESESSGSFRHPERYLVDAPMYMAKPDQGPQEYQLFRSDGLCPIRRDSADAACAVLSEGEMAVEDLRAPHGLTHLHLSNNHISSFGLQRLLRTSNGQIEDLSCDSLPLLPSNVTYPKAWPKSSSLRGILGAAYLFRPAVASNLRVLRIHHSLVTYIPTLDLEGVSTLGRIWLSENKILPLVDKAYAQVFVPDMNPRLTSLTLTCIPRRSSGPLVERLIEFLKLLSMQERDIEEMKLLTSSWRGPGLLKGLRHLRLELESDPLQDGFSASDDLDAEELLSSGDQGFSFFGNEWAGRVPPEAKPRSQTQDSANSSTEGVNQDSSQSVRTSGEEYLTYHIEWNGDTYSIPVWVGSKSPASNPIIDRYRGLVAIYHIREGVGPATPAQILAGAPAGSYIFHTAWCMAIMPSDLTPPPTSQLTGMKDVLDELKRYRLEGRVKYSELRQKNGTLPTPLGGPHFFWTGKLEVSLEEPAAHARPSQYWR